MTQPHPHVPPPSPAPIDKNRLNHGCTRMRTDLNLVGRRCRAADALVAQASAPAGSSTVPVRVPVRATTPGGRSVAVPGHSDGRIAMRICQSAAGRFCHVAAPGDGRTPMGTRIARMNANLNVVGRRCRAAGRRGLRGTTALPIRTRISRMHTDFNHKARRAGIFVEPHSATVQAPSGAASCPPTKVMPPRRGWRFCWREFLQRCHADGATAERPISDHGNGNENIGGTIQRATWL